MTHLCLCTIINFIAEITEKTDELKGKVEKERIYLLNFLNTGVLKMPSFKVANADTPTLTMLILTLTIALAVQFLPDQTGS